MSRFSIHGDLSVDNPDNLNRQPFNDQNPDGPLELCTCKDCGAPIMLDDKQKRIRAVAPSLMGFDPASMPATYHAFYDPGHRRSETGRRPPGLRRTFAPTSSGPRGPEKEPVPNAKDPEGALPSGSLR